LFYSALRAFMLAALVAPAAAVCMPLHGLVLATQAAKGEAVVRHDAVGGMPGMTMTFRVASPQVLGRLRPGQTIDATADTNSEPWVLYDVRILGTESLVGAQGSSSRPYSAIRNVTPLVAGSLVPDTQFIDLDGKPFRFSQLRGQNIVTAFIYTRCRDPRMCPLISSKFHRLQELLRGTNTHLVEISLDPAFDRPPVLKRYAHIFGVDPSRWTLLTGDVDRTLDFAAQFDVSALADPRYGIVHSERTVLLDSNGVVRVLLDETAWSPEEIVAEIKAIGRLPANPLARFNLWLSAKAAAMCGDRAAGFSGVGDLLVVVVILAGSAWLLYRLARAIFRH